MPHLAGLVLARGGSKSIPRKNIRPLGGKPLIAWVLSPMLQCPSLQSVWVSTEDSEVARVSQECGAQVHHRNKVLASDEAKSVDCVQEFLSRRLEVTHVVLVQCTSPCLDPGFLERAWTLVQTSKYDSVFSVTRQFRFRWQEVEEGQSTRPLNLDPATRPRRQDWRGELVESGHFYLTSAELIKKGLIQGGKCGYVEVPSAMCLEIDNLEDWPIAEVLVKTYGHRERQSS